MKAIVVKQIAQANTKPRQIEVRAEGTKARRFSMEALNSDEPERDAAETYARDLDWLHGGWKLEGPGTLLDGHSKVFVFVQHSKIYGT